jgi:pimeloyl-ACP methyl ester carboxylesterase
MPFADINQHHLYYETQGEGPRVVIMSHGFVLDHAMWDAQVEELSNTHKVIVWDERGHGMSDCKGPFTYWDSAADLIALMDVEEAETAVLVGMSQGGWLTLRAALEHPKRVDGVVMVSSATQAFSPEEQEGYRQMAAAWTTAGPVGELSDTMAAIQFGTTYDGSAWIGKWRARPPTEWAVPWSTIVNQLAAPEEVLDKRLGEITSPVMVIHGSEDLGFPIARAHEMASWFPNCAGVTVIDGAGHCPPVTHPDQVNTALRTFLGSL